MGGALVLYVKTLMANEPIHFNNYNFVFLMCFSFFDFHGLFCECCVLRLWLQFGAKLLEDHVLEHVGTSLDNLLVHPPNKHHGFKDLVKLPHVA